MKIFFLNDNNINLAFDIRRKVFIDEQKIEEHIEFDNTDKDAKNIILTINDKPIGTGRLIIINNKIYIGRVAILKDYRNKGYGSNLIKFLLDEAKNMGYNEVFIHAQSYAKTFYENLGFKAFGDEFLEANIPHISMKIQI